MGRLGACDGRRGEVVPKESWDKWDQGSIVADIVVWKCGLRWLFPFNHGDVDKGNTNVLELL